MNELKGVSSVRRRPALKTPAKGEPQQAKPKADAATANVKRPVDQEDELARFSLRPTVEAAFTVHAYHRDSKGIPGAVALIHELGKQVEAVNGGDLNRPEAMLIAQAHSLDAIFGCLARRAAAYVGEYMGVCDTYLRLALKAQSQCRATLETLAAIKNPPVVYARQANVTTGPQQVNNGVPSQAREIESQQSKLSGETNELLPDTRASALTSRVDSQVATVGEVNRTEVKCG